MSKDWISEQLVSRAIENGSPDNVTVIIANLSELYSRWQRSTPFQVNTKGIRYSLGNELYDKFRNQDYDFQWNSVRKSMNYTWRAGIDEMGIDGDLSPDSGNPWSTGSSWKPKSDWWTIKNSLENEKNDEALSNPDITFEPEKKSNSNPFCQPNITSSVRHQKNTEKILRQMTGSKRNSQRLKFGFGQF